jgi:hypothetical protein
VVRCIPGREGGGISTTMTMATTNTKTTTKTTVNNDNDEDLNGKDNGEDNDDLIFDSQQPTCGRMHSWQGGGVILTMMTMATTMAGRGVDSDKDKDKDPNGN